MKKINITLVVLLTALSLTGCGITINIDTGKDDKKTTEQVKKETQETEDATIIDIPEKEFEESKESEDIESYNDEWIIDSEDYWFDDPDFYWPDFGISEKLPSVDWFLTGEIDYNFDSCLSATISHVNKDQFREYTKLCYDSGYTKIQVNSSDCYIADNEYNILVYLEYFEDDQIMTIYIEDYAYTEE